MECRATLHVSYYHSLPAVIYKCKDTTWSVYLYGHLILHGVWKHSTFCNIHIDIGMNVDTEDTHTL